MCLRRGGGRYRLGSFQHTHGLRHRLNAHTRPLSTPPHHHHHGCRHDPMQHLTRLLFLRERLLAIQHFFPHCLDLVVVVVET